MRVGVCLWRHMCTGCCVSALPNSLPGLGKGESVSWGRGGEEEGGEENEEEASAHVWVRVFRGWGL